MRSVGADLPDAVEQRIARLERTLVLDRIVDAVHAERTEPQCAGSEELQPRVTKGALRAVHFFSWRKVHFPHTQIRLLQRLFQRLAQLKSRARGLGRIRNDLDAAVYFPAEIQDERRCRLGTRSGRRLNDGQRTTFFRRERFQPLKATRSTMSIENFTRREREVHQEGRDAVISRPAVKSAVRNCLEKINIAFDGAEIPGSSPAGIVESRRIPA